MQKYSPLHGCLLILGLVLLVKSTNAQVKISSLSILNRIDTFINNSKILINRVDYYLVKDNSDSSSLNFTISNFVDSNKVPNFKSYSNYSMVFFRESVYTNLKNISLDKRIVERYTYDNDSICSYWWSKGVFKAYYEYKDGRSILMDRVKKIKDP